MKQKQTVLGWNHISKNLSDDQVNELKQYYLVYHKQHWCYKQAFKRLKRWKLAANISSLTFGAGGILSAAVTGGSALVAISGTALIIQAVLKWEDVGTKLSQSLDAVQEYEHILVQLRDIPRSGNFNQQEPYQKLQLINDMIVNHSTIILDKHKKKSLLKFTSE